MTWQTRLFPNGQGIDKITNKPDLVENCDFSIITDTKSADYIASGSLNFQFAFLSLRNPEIAISSFIKEALPFQKQNFILFSGSSDRTIPTQIDRRFGAFTNDIQEKIFHILDSKFLVHWYAENLEHNFHPKISAIPLGFAFKHRDETVIFDEVSQMSPREKKYLCFYSSRVRESSQFLKRKIFYEKLKHNKSSKVFYLEKKVGYSKYLILTALSNFSLCISGGGLDPCPKAWEALWLGCVPVVESSSLDNFWQNYPVIIIDDFCSISIQDLVSKLEESILPQKMMNKEYLIEVRNRMKFEYLWTNLTNRLRH